MATVSSVQKGLCDAPVRFDHLMTTLPQLSGCSVHASTPTTDVRQVEARFGKRLCEKDGSLCAGVAGPQL